MVSFHATTQATTGAGTSIVTLQLDGAPVTGGTAQHYLPDTTTTATIGFTIPVTVSSATQTLTVESQNADMQYTDATLTVWKIGVTS